MEKILATLFLCFLFVPGCAEKAPKEDHLIKNVIRKYNRSLIDAYKKGDMRQLSLVANKEEIRKIKTLAAIERQQNNYLDAKLHEIVFREINKDLESNKAEVKTKEHWSYIYRNIETREIVEPAKEMFIFMHYTLEKLKDKWIITNSLELNNNA